MTIDQVLKKRNSTQDGFLFFWAYSVMIDFSCSRIFQYFLLLISKIQLISIFCTVQNSVYIASNDPFSNFLSSITNYFTGYIFILNSEYEVISITIYISLFFGLLFITFLAIGLILYHKNIPEPFRIKFGLALFSKIYHEFIFWNIGLALISVYNSSLSFKIFGIQNTDYLCKIIVLILYILNLGYGLLSTFYCNDPFVTHNPLAVRKLHVQGLEFLVKFISTIILGAGNLESSLGNILISIFYTITCGYSCYFIINNCPYFDYLVMKYSMGFYAYTFASNLITIIWTIFQKEDLRSLYYCQIIVGLMCCKWIEILQEVKARTEVLKKNDDEKSIFVKLYYWNKAIHSAKMSLNGTTEANDQDLKLYMLLKYHEADCYKDSCYCHTLIAGQNSGLDFNKMKNYYLRFSREIKYILLAKLNSNLYCKLQLIYLLCQEDQFDNRLFIEAFSSLSNLKCQNYFESVLRHAILKKIEAKLLHYYQTREDGININEFIEYQKNVSIIPDLIYSNTTKVIEFWEAYKQEEIHMNELFLLSIKIEKEAEILEKTWENFMKVPNNSSFSLAMLYSSYLKTVRNRNFKSRDITRKQKTLYRSKENMESHITRGSLKNSNTVGVFISLSRHSQEKIIYVTHGISKLLGYYPEEIKNKRFTDLIPDNMKTDFLDLINQSMNCNFVSLNKNLEVHLRFKRAAE